MRVAVVLACAALLGACGFHLLGAGAEGLRSVAVVYHDPYAVVPPPLIDALKAQLDGGGAPAGRLQIDVIEDSRRVLAVSPEDGRAIGYELITTVGFDFAWGGEPLLIDQTLTARRAYSFDNTARLVAETQRRELIAAMHEELANLIVLRMETAVAALRE